MTKCKLCGQEVHNIGCDVARGEPENPVAALKREIERLRKVEKMVSHTLEEVIKERDAAIQRAEEEARHVDELCSIIEWVDAVLNGASVPDFAESFAVVRKAVLVRGEVKDVSALADEHLWQRDEETQRAEIAEQAAAKALDDRDEALTRIGQLVDEMDVYQATLARVTQERDEAREEVKHWKGVHEARWKQLAEAVNPDLLTENPYEAAARVAAELKSRSLEVDALEIDLDARFCAWGWCGAVNPDAPECNPLLCPGCDNCTTAPPPAATSCSHSHVQSAPTQCLECGAMVESLIPAPPPSSDAAKAPAGEEDGDV